MEGWARQELKNAQLGDARRTKRLILIVENLATFTRWDCPGS